MTVEGVEAEEIASAACTQGGCPSHGETAVALAGVARRLSVELETPGIPVKSSHLSTGNIYVIAVNFLA